MAEVVGGRFALIDQIGSGGAGTIWRAYDHRAARYCAVKLMRPDDATALIRVVREQGVRLAHPHILSPYAWAADDSSALIASDLVAGGSLLGLIRDHGALPWRYAAEIIAQLIGALRHVHRAGLVHRDVKPGNVLLEATGTGSPHARLADFGIAHRTGGPRITQIGLVVGTPGYLAPEILAGQGPEPGQDLFAVGVVAWQLLTGEENATDRRDVVPPGVPDQLWQAVRLLLDPDPLARSSGVARALRQLHALLDRHQLDLPARTADGEILEVFDVVGPLPRGWTARGPAPDESTSRVEESAAIAPTLAAPTPTRHGPPPTIPAEPDPLTRRPRWNRVTRRWAFVPVGVAAAAGIAAAVLLASDDRPPTPTGPESDPPGVPSETNASRTPRPGVTAGAACDWQDIGHEEVGANGRTLRCTHQSDGGQSWQPAG